MCKHVSVWMCACHGIHEDIENHWLEFVIIFYHVCFEDQSQLIRLGGKCSYSLSHLTGPKYFLLIYENLSQLNKKVF